jgi:hypothetical protein
MTDATLLACSTAQGITSTVADFSNKGVLGVHSARADHRDAADDHPVGLPRSYPPGLPAAPFTRAPPHPNLPPRPRLPRQRLRIVTAEIRS